MSLQHSVHPLSLPFLLGREKRGGLSLLPKRGVLEGRGEFLEGSCWERGGDLFRGGGSEISIIFLSVIKSEMLNGKKVYKQKCFPLS